MQLLRTQRCFLNRADDVYQLDGKRLKSSISEIARSQPGFCLVKLANAILIWIRCLKTEKFAMPRKVLLMLHC